MADDSGLVLDEVRVQFGQWFNYSLVMFPMYRLEVAFLADLPVHLEIADRVEAFEHGLVLRGATGKEL